MSPKPFHILAIPIQMIVNISTYVLMVTHLVEMAASMDKYLMKNPKIVIGHDMSLSGNFN